MQGVHVRMARTVIDGFARMIGHTGWDRIDVPCCGGGFKKPDHETAGFGSDICVRRRVFNHRPIRVNVSDRIGDEVVVLGSLPSGPRWAHQ